MTVAQSVPQVRILQALQKASLFFGMQRLRAAPERVTLRFQ